MNFSISMRSVFALIAYVTCFIVSYILLWDDQLRLTLFHIDPHQSLVTRFLVKHSLYDMDNTARVLGTVLAFASIHLSWSCRYYVGDRFMAAYARRSQNKSGVGITDIHDVDTFEKISNEKNDESNRLNKKDDIAQ